VRKKLSIENSGGAWVAGARGNASPARTAAGSGNFFPMVTKPKTDADTLVLDSAFAEAVETARANVDAGQTVPYEKVRKWLRSWGTAKELPRPRCK
jgi:hypothetical protein